MMRKPWWLHYERPPCQPLCRKLENCIKLLICLMEKWKRCQNIYFQGQGTISWHQISCVMKNPLLDQKERQPLCWNLENCLKLPQNKAVDLESCWNSARCTLVFKIKTGLVAVDPSQLPTSANRMTWAGKCQEYPVHALLHLQVINAIARRTSRLTVIPSIDPLTSATPYLSSRTTAWQGGVRVPIS